MIAGSRVNGSLNVAIGYNAGANRNGDGHVAVGYDVKVSPTAVFQRPAGGFRHVPSEAKSKVYGWQAGRAYKLDCRMPKCLYNILQFSRGHRAFCRTEMPQTILNVIQRSCIRKREFPWRERMPVEGHEGGDAQNGGSTIEARLSIELVRRGQIFDAVYQSKIG